MPSGFTYRKKKPHMRLFQFPVITQPVIQILQGMQKV